MSRYIGQYISTCNLCLYTKPTRHSLVCELYPLLVSGMHWDILGVNFVIELPESAGCDIFMTVVDSVSKRAHFIPAHTMVTAEGTVWLFLYHV